MSYINLKEVSSENNSEVCVSLSEYKLEVFAKEDVVLELTCGEYEFNAVVAGGSTLRYRKGGIQILVSGSSGEVISVNHPTKVRYDHGIFSLKYQRHYSEDAVVATVDVFHDWDNGCNLISLQLHPNDGSYKGNRSSQIFSLCKNKDNPLVKMLLKARTKGAGAINFTPDGVFLYMPDKTPEQQKSCSNKAEALHALVCPLFGSKSTTVDVLKKSRIDL